MLLCCGKNQRFQIGFAQFKNVHVGTDDAELFSLFSTHLSVHGSKDFFIGGVHAFGAKDRHIRNRFVGLF